MLISGAPFLYVLGITEPFPDKPPSSFDLLSSSRVHIVFAPGPSEIIKRAAEIDACIASQYALRYTSTSANRDRRLHKIKINLSRPDVKVKVESLAGYYIPST